LSHLDIAEHRRAQSGKIILRYQNSKIEYRIEITPTVGANEDAVLRILSATKPIPIDQIGLTPVNLERYRTAIGQSYGIVLCVGPTGSGKTTTLHSTLGHINTSGRKIWTAEDPVEITQDGLRQVQVNPKIGFTFQEALRSFLRADPDVIMIGEMRDHETAKTAIEASLTGHLVFSTLHTNSAPETLRRLIEMGMDPISFAEALLAVLAQRLARRLCEKCKKTYSPSKKEYDEIVELYGAQLFSEDNINKFTDKCKLAKRVGCIKCDDIGYHGRIAIIELLLNSEEIKLGIKEQLSVEELRKIAIRDGMRTLRMDGVHKIFEGYTDPKEIIRVC
jgi:type II secretory ATPase GspE/PulE/Tfp pilus assembly ATPase PilB-like protein